jgi:hypothetical protein
MSNINQETIDRIWQDAKAYAKLHRKSIGGTYAQNYAAGATEWAGRAVCNKEREIAFATWCNKNYQQNFGGWKSWSNPTTCFYTIEQLWAIWQKCQKEVNNG